MLYTYSCAILYHHRFSYTIAFCRGSVVSSSFFDSCLFNRLRDICMAVEFHCIRRSRKVLPVEEKPSPITTADARPCKSIRNPNVNTLPSIIVIHQLPRKETSWKHQMTLSMFTTLPMINCLVEQNNRKRSIESFPPFDTLTNG